MSKSSVLCHGCSTEAHMPGLKGLILVYDIRGSACAIGSLSAAGALAYEE